MSCACHWPDDPVVRRAMELERQDQHRRELEFVQQRTNDQREWDETFLDMASLLADRRSKDPSTKVGALIVSPNGKTIVSMGYNGFPRGMSDDPALYEDRETKYSRIIHAEMNAILNAKGGVEDCTLYVTFPPCDRCAVFVVQAGIKRVVVRPVTGEAALRWLDSLRKTGDIFAEAGIPLIYLPKE